MRTLVLFFLLASTTLLFGQSSSFQGNVSGVDGPLYGATVVIPALNLGTTSDAAGAFRLSDIPAGTHRVEVRYFGFVTKKDSVTFRTGEPSNRTYTLHEDQLKLEEVVISGTRNAIPRYDSPVIVNTVSSRTFEATQSLSIAEGLSFSPGLRVENNCQNCGFTQLRMNGLDGAYSQVLINSRPIFSALAGVYGLEMIPASMIDRVEVVRGGGSVMFGGNAIAGTVNIITKDPMQNGFEVGVNQGLINGEASDRSVNFNGSIVSDDLDKGISFFGFNRTRNPWDANGDGFSEMVQLENNTFGFDAFWNLNERNKLQLGAYYIKEDRRGGNKFHLAPHQTDVTESLQHDILSTNVSYEIYSKDYKHKLSLYGSMQTVDRASYYGGGGRVLQPGDSLMESDLLAINAYGNSEDLSLVGGIQYNYEIHSKWMLITGMEYIYNDVSDAMPGYGRVIDQQVATWGSYAQIEYQPFERLTFLVGGRFDQLSIDGNYDLAEERFQNDRDLNVFVPRLSGLLSISNDLQLRASFAQGYRGPQAFDEDLHIETVGGTARFIRIDPDLLPETSNSALLSLNYDKSVEDNQFNFVVEGFYTQLLNPFILSGQTELPNGVAVINKRNGSGARVSGVNLEANIALRNKLILQSGATIQTALYDEMEEIWAPETEDNTASPALTDRILRTPNTYGYYSMTYQLTKAFNVAYSGVITGEMIVPHVVDVESERTVLKETPTFFEHNLNTSYTFNVKDGYRMECFAGVQNILNSYQSDFDRGAERDAGYVYGPTRPRTYFAGIKFGLQ